MQLISTAMALAVAFTTGIDGPQEVSPATGAVSSGAFEVVRHGDGDMSCEALISEINTLNAEVQTLQARMTDMGAEMSRSAMAATRRPGGLGLGLAGAVANFVPGAGLLSGAASMMQQQANQASAQQQQQQIMEGTASLSEAVTAMAPLANRAAHLSEIARDKRC